MRIKAGTTGITRYLRKYHVSNIVLLLIPFLFSPAKSAPIAKGADKFLGNTTPSQSNGIRSDFNNYWNQITPENAGKWGSVERTRDVMSWGSLDMAYTYARENGFVFKQHTFVWGNQEPSWIGGLSAEEQREEVEEWIKAYGERYPETDFIDVVNEPINRPASYREALGGAGETGWDWIIWTFKKARAYCPNAKLLINEFDVVNNPLILEHYLQIINLLRERKLIDGIGIQSHCFSVQETMPDTIINHLDRLAATGLPLYPSELDLLGDDNQQLNLYKGYFPVFWEHPAVAGITIWGWEYNRTWIKDTHLLTGTGAERPALTWLREYIAEHPSSTRSFSGSPQKDLRPPLISTGAGGTLQMHLTGPHTVTLRLIDIQGRALTDKVRYTLPAGKHSLPCRTSRSSAGARIVQLSIDDNQPIRKVLVEPLFR